jgi:hypothetical protein
MLFCTMLLVLIIENFITSLQTFSMKKFALILSFIIIFVSVYAQAPVNDEPCGAIDVPVLPGEPILVECIPSTVYTYSNATLTPGIPNPTCGNIATPQNIRDVWYKFIVPASGVFLINTQPANTNTDYTMAIYAAMACNGAFTEIACNDDYTGLYPRILGTGTVGQTLFLRIFRFAAVADINGDFKMCISDYSINNNPIVNNTTKVGIGITNPLAKLDVAGTGLFRDKVTFVKNVELRAGLQLSNNAGVGKILTSDASGNASWLLPVVPTNYWSLNGGSIYNNNGGNVGIGTTTPTTAKLVVSGTNGVEGIDLSSTDQYANMRVIRNSLFGADKDMYIGFQSGANSSLHLFSNNNETVTVKNGNVGIGINVPNAPLTFTNTLTHKITLFQGSIGPIGIGAYPGELRLQNDIPSGKVSLGTLDAGGLYLENALAQRSGVFAFSVLGSLWVNGTTYSSDERFKENITSIASPLQKLLQINGVEYEMKTTEFPKHYFQPGRQIGLLAQNVEKIIPEAVGEKDGYKGVDYARLVPLLIESIKEQQKQIDELKLLVQKLLNK